MLLLGSMALCGCLPKAATSSTPASATTMMEVRRLMMRSPGADDRYIWEFLVPKGVVDDLLQADATAACAAQLADAAWAGCSLVISNCVTVLYRGGEQAILRLDGIGCAPHLPPVDHWLAFGRGATLAGVVDVPFRPRASGDE